MQNIVANAGAMCYYSNINEYNLFVRSEEMSLSSSALGRVGSARRSVLVVDDEAINRQMLGFMLQNDYDVLFAENGREAWDVLAERADKVSIVLLDLMMPVMDGYEMLTMMKADPEKRRIPVIVSTAAGEAEVRALKMGAVDFIRKPYDAPEVILARVQRSIELAEDASIISATETDHLTGLYIKQFFYEYSGRSDFYAPDAPMDAAVLNINRFHLVNELFGQEAGDKALVVLAAHLRSIAVEVGGFAGRGDADTFYLYLPHRDDYVDILNGAGAVLAEALPDTHISIRLGVYQNVDKSITLERRFDHANLASIRFRGGHESHVGFYDSSMHDRELYTERLLADADRAIAERQFRVYFQPKYNIKGDRPVLCSAEALIRWIHPELGFVSPGAFIPVFEEHGIIHKLDVFVWNETAAQIRRWREEFGFTLPVSVNVSRVDMQTDGLEEQLARIVKDNGIGFEDLRLEVTESAYAEDESAVVGIVSNLRELGFRIEMDDFGSGYSSLNMLSEMPIDTLKLDMRFVKNLTAGSKGLRMIELVVGVAKFLEAQVIAEGVETAEQVDLLRGCGCDMVQGYYFSKPVPPDEFSKFITPGKENG